MAKNEIEAMISYLGKNVAHPVVRQVQQQLAPKCRSWASDKANGILREMTLIVDSMKASVESETYPATGGQASRAASVEKGS